MKRKKILINWLRFVMIVPISLLCLPLFWLLYAFAHDAWLAFIESEGKKALGRRMQKHGLKEVTWEINETKEN